MRCIAFVTVPLLAGCGGGGSGGTSAAPRAVSVTLPDGLIGTLSEDRTAITAGQTVTYTMTLTNPTQQPISYQNDSIINPVGNSVAGELSVADPAGKPDGPGFGGAVGYPQVPVVLAPGKSASTTYPLTYAVAGINQEFTTAGQYTATAMFFIVPVADGVGSYQPTPVTPPLAVEVQ